VPSFLQRALGSATSAAGSLALSYGERAGIALLFVLAGAFAIAAIAGILINRFGQVKAYWFLTGGFILIGAIASWGIRLMERQAETRQQEEVTKATEAATQEAVKLRSHLQPQCSRPPLAHPLLSPSHASLDAIGRLRCSSALAPAYSGLAAQGRGASQMALE
jgi:hypothetical protein